MIRLLLCNNVSKPPSHTVRTKIVRFLVNNLYLSINLIILSYLLSFASTCDAIQICVLQSASKESFKASTNVCLALCVGRVNRECQASPKTYCVTPTNKALFHSRSTSCDALLYNANLGTFEVGRG